MEKRDRSETRKHYFLDEYVVIAPGRFKRPHDYEIIEKTKRVRKCHFCEEMKGKRKKRKFIEAVWDGKSKSNNKHWAIAVIPNKYPAFSLDNKNAYGSQEIVIESPKHVVSFSDLPVRRIRQILDVFQNRITVLEKLPKIKYILVFKNDGPNSGASLSHVHSQIYAASLYPAELQREIEGIGEYFSKTGKCPYCDIAEKESRSKRKIYEDDYMIAFAPYSSKYKFEAWVISKRHAHTLLDLNAAEKDSLARILKMLISYLDKNNFSYNFFTHFIRGGNLHFYLKLIPRIGSWGGVEAASESDLIINPVSPEMARNFYQGKLKP